MRILLSKIKYWAKHQRDWFAKWHLYLGLFAGVIISIVGITGSTLVFRDEIDAALNPTLYKVYASKSRLSIDEMLAKHYQETPHDTVTYIQWRDDQPASTYIFYIGNKSSQVFVNPYTGKKTGARLYSSGFTNVVMDLHRTLLIPTVGRYIVALSSLILLIMTITGLKLWIPKKWKYLKSVLTVNFKASAKRQNYDWHNTLGFYSAPVITLLTITGFFITFYLPAIVLVFSLSGKHPKEVADIFQKKSTYIAQKKPISITESLAIGHQYMPDGHIEGMTPPNDSTGVFRLDVRCPGVSKDGRREFIMIDQYSGKVLGDSRSLPNVAQSILSWLIPIHLGTFGGLPTKILTAICGLVPAALFFTGFIIWWPRWKKQRKDLEKPIKRQVPISVVPIGKNYFVYQLKYGFRYALYTIPIAFCCGALYGLIAGIILPPAVFAIIYMALLTVGNFIIALIVLIFQVIFLLPFKRSYRPIWKYFGISLSFLIVYVLMFALLMNTGLKIF